MVYTEQKIRNKNRTYYHGSLENELNINKASYDMLFLTTDPVYAVKYADNEFGDVGYIFSFRLKDEVNIFNSKCISDLHKLHKNMPEPKIGWSVFDNTLKDFDWYVLELKYHIDRDYIFNIIKGLGYDGVTQVNEGKFKYNDTGFHSMGIFNPNVLLLENITDYVSFKTKFHNVETMKDKKVSYAKCGFYLMDERFVNFTDDELLDFIKQKSGLTDKDLIGHKERILENNRKVEKLILDKII